MEIKLGSNKVLLLIIGVLVIYMLFFNNTSGYKDQPSNRIAYEKGFEDFNDNKSMDTTRFKFKRELVDRRSKTTYLKPQNDEAKAYKQGYKDAAKLAKKKLQDTLF